MVYLFCDSALKLMNFAFSVEYFVVLCIIINTLRIAPRPNAAKERSEIVIVVRCVHPHTPFIRRLIGDVKHIRNQRYLTRFEFSFLLVYFLLAFFRNLTNFCF